MLSKYIWIIFFLLTLCILSCRRDDYYEGNDVQITFSEDTLRFDTVFTTLGSATRYIKVYNPKDQPILVDIELKNQSNSFFRINADGIKGPTIRSLEINSRDSIYIFVEVTIDPDKPLSVSPFIIEDQILVSVNGNSSITYLEAWGQNANYIPSSNGKGGGALLSCSFGSRIWDDPKPYVIYGILYIDSCQLILPPGTKIYVHGGVVRNENSIYNDGLLVFYKNGRLISQGTIENPVIIQGDRLEEEYKDIKSQWVGILFWHECKKNVLRNTIIKNSIIGIRADSLAEVSMYGCQIFNTGGPAVIGRHGKIYAENCLFYDNSTYGLQLTYGGDYEFNYCTVANYEGQDESVILTDFYCEDILCSTGVKLNKLNAMFSNCIFSGSAQDEIGLSQASEDDNNFIYHFSHCAVRVDELLDPENTPDFFDHCDNCINLKSNDRLFLNQNENDYRLDTMSVALNKGKSLPLITTDILGKIRKSVPDIGCFEF
ncbi:MAG: right-handed parallel beta-helix repeat-containing protein [Saprospiraceae bacterium]|nr:right-handed parallel beta-helix repeat-containing protein [Saprospiraceae bacterium]